MMRFFTEEVLQPRFPRTMTEGVMKGFLLGGMILGSYDALSSISKTITEQGVKSQNILTGYGLFILMGALCGIVGEYCLQNQQEPPRIRR